MKLSMIFCCLLCFGISLFSQDFSGDWCGKITRDFGHEVKTDSIMIHLEQDGQNLTGYSVLFVAPGLYIKSTLSGEIQSANKLLRITETNMDVTNIPDRGGELFLDRYLLYYDQDTLHLSGKSVATNSKVIYSRSKMEIRKLTL